MSVSGEWVGPIGTGTITLTQNANTGIWSGSMALPNDLYSYTFTVNGVGGITDPSNPPWNGEGIDSQIFVPASNSSSNPVEYDQWLSPDNSVPHGTLQQSLVATPNSTGPYANGNHPISVYLPPGYNADCSTRYPVLYLQHGGGGNDVDWSTQGYAGIIEDNLLAQGLARPMMIVMPNFNNTASVTDPTTGLSDEEDGFRQDLIEAYIPWAESHFCVKADRADRAYAGLSQGAAYGQNVIENSANYFADFGIWSPACIDSSQPDCGRSPTVAELETGPGATTITCVHFGSGVNDFYGAETTVATEQANLDAAGIPNRLHMTPIQDDAPAPPATDGGSQADVAYERQTSHTWNSWREQLRDALMTVFFQPQQDCSLAAPTNVPESPSASLLLVVVPVAFTGFVAFRRQRRATTRNN
ncbi:MAG: hypothetical protein JOY80_00920 [Candidatus Dormibacteraeota bacterium]|nr:hypothetical protein [Candidatus Dormibacteraeota bacterium]